VQSARSGEFQTFADGQKHNVIAASADNNRADTAAAGN
jgi:hypothetical protein